MGVPVLPEGSFTITKSDTQDLPQKAYGIFVEGAGSVVFIGVDGKQDTVNLAAGAIYPVQMIKVLSATTATGIHGFSNK